MTDWIKYMKNHPEAEVPDLEGLLDNIDRFFGDRIDDAAEKNTQDKAEMVESAIDEYVTQMQTVDVIREKRRRL